MLIEEIDLWGINQGKASTPSNPQQLTQNDKVAKAKKILLDCVKDSLIPHIAGKLEKVMFNAMITLYQSQ